MLSDIAHLCVVRTGHFNWNCEPLSRVGEHNEVVAFMKLLDKKASSPISRRHNDELRLFATLNIPILRSIQLQYIVFGRSLLAFLRHNDFAAQGNDRSVEALLSDG